MSANEESDDSTATECDAHDAKHSLLRKDEERDDDGATRSEPRNGMVGQRCKPRLDCDVAPKREASIPVGIEKLFSGARYERGYGRDDRQGRYRDEECSRGRS